MSSARPLQLHVTVTEVMTETREYLYPGLDKTTTEEDETRRVVSTYHIFLDDGPRQGVGGNDLKTMFYSGGVNQSDFPERRRSRIITDNPQA